MVVSRLILLFFAMLDHFYALVCLAPGFEVVEYLRLQQQTMLLGQLLLSPGLLALEYLTLGVLIPFMMELEWFHLGSQK